MRFISFLLLFILSVYFVLLLVWRIVKHIRTCKTEKPHKRGDFQKKII